MEDVPPAAVTVMSTGPAEPAGETTVIDVLLVTVGLVPSVDPKRTVAPVTKLVPVRVTVVPPPTGPAVGARPVTVGAAQYVNSELVAD
jgi:hypothetical protein